MYCLNITSLASFIGIWSCESFFGHFFLFILIFDITYIDECKNPIYKNYCSRGCVNTPGSFICKRPNKKAKMAMIGMTIILIFLKNTHKHEHRNCHVYSYLSLQ